jgi:hypothetical protein
MRADIDIDRGGDTHERVKEYAREHGLRLPRAYADLIEAGLTTTDE